MKKLLVLLFSMLISFNSHGEWTWVNDNIDNNSYYSDNKTIKKIDGYVFVWSLEDFNVPFDIVYSAKIYKKIDCLRERTDDIRVIYYDQPMGEGEIYLSDDSPEIEWYYPIPDSSFYSLMDYVCKYIE